MTTSEDEEPEEAAGPDPAGAGAPDDGGGPLMDESCWRFKERPLRVFGPPGIARFITTALEVSRTIMPGDLVITELDLAYRDAERVDARRAEAGVGAGGGEANPFYRYGDGAFGDHALVEEPVCVDPCHPTLRRIFVRSLQADHPDTVERGPGEARPGEAAEDDRPVNDR